MTPDGRRDRLRTWRDCTTALTSSMFRLAIALRASCCFATRRNTLYPAGRAVGAPAGGPRSLSPASPHPLCLEFRPDGETLPYELTTYPDKLVFTTPLGTVPVPRSIPKRCIFLCRRARSVYVSRCRPRMPLLTVEGQPFTEFATPLATLTPGCAPVAWHLIVGAGGMWNS